MWQKWKYAIARPIYIERRRGEAFLIYYLSRTSIKGDGPAKRIMKSANRNGHNF